MFIKVAKELLKELPSQLPVIYSIIVAYVANYFIFRGFRWDSFWFTTLIIYISLMGSVLYRNHKMIQKLKEDLRSLQEGLSD